jgi:parallel beta-helix repeat protein/predicted outer membrane repeat protein
MKKFSGIIFALILVLAMAAAGSPLPALGAQPSEVWVDDDFTPATSGWGSTHFDKIQDGIDAVASPGTVNVADGTYYESISLKAAVAVLGSRPCVIDGSTARGGEPAYHVVIGADGATLDSVTITGGNASAIYNDRYGGGIYNEGGTLTVTNSTITGNTARYGGGIYCTESTLIITNCDIEVNTAVYFYGGGIYSSNSSLTVTNCIFTGNDAGSNGGGMYINNSPSAITYCGFRDNSAGSGGGMFNGSSSTTVTSCTFSGNTAKNGGGMLNSECSPTVTECLFENNTARQGGGMNNSESSPIITNCTFSGNTATTDGGGMHNLCYSSPTITNCIFNNNTAFWGGGMQNFYYSSPTITNCTISRNTADDKGGGINTYDNSSPTVMNCILWGDTGDEIYTDVTSSTDVSYSDIQGGYPGAGNINDDPLFVNTVGDYHLQIGSPCIDKGTNVGAPPEDIEGTYRPFDGDKDGEAITDMGAYEYAPSAPQLWYLDSEITPAGYQMEKGDGPGDNGQTGSTNIGSGESAVWLADQAALCDVTFPNGSWVAEIRTDADWGTGGDMCGVSVGGWNIDTGWYEIPTLNVTQITWDNEVNILKILLKTEAATIYQDDYLALSIKNNDSSSHTIYTEGRSSLRSPDTDPGYPIPGLASGLLLGFGLLSLAGYLGLKKRKVTTIKA